MAVVVALEAAIASPKRRSSTKASLRTRPRRSPRPAMRSGKGGDAPRRPAGGWSCGGRRGPAGSRPRSAAWCGTGSVSGVGEIATSKRTPSGREGVQDGACVRPRRRRSSPPGRPGGCRSSPAGPVRATALSGRRASEPCRSTSNVRTAPRRWPSRSSRSCTDRPDRYGSCREAAPEAPKRRIGSDRRGPTRRVYCALRSRLLGGRPRPMSGSTITRFPLRPTARVALLGALVALLLGTGCGGDIESRMAEVRALQDVGQFSAAPSRSCARSSP